MAGVKRNFWITLAILSGLVLFVSLFFGVGSLLYEIATLGTFHSNDKWSAPLVAGVAGFLLWLSLRKLGTVTGRWGLLVLTKRAIVIFLVLLLIIGVGSWVYEANDKRFGDGPCRIGYYDDEPCVPNSFLDIDCKDVGTPVRYLDGEDVYHLDADGNGIGCEDYDG